MDGKKKRRYIPGYRRWQEGPWSVRGAVNSFQHGGTETV